MSRQVLIIARADAADAFRSALESAHGGEQGRIAAVEYRRTGDAPGSVSHYIAHGALEGRVFGVIVAAMNSATKGKRRSVDWEGKPGAGIANASWAYAMDGDDVVAGFRVTGDVSPPSVLAELGLIATASDLTPMEQETHNG